LLLLLLLVLVVRIKEASSSLAFESSLTACSRLDLQQADLQRLLLRASKEAQRKINENKKAPCPIRSVLAPLVSKKISVSNTERKLPGHGSSETKTRRE